MYFITNNNNYYYRISIQPTYLVISRKSAPLTTFMSSDVNHISRSFSAPSKKYSGISELLRCCATASATLKLIFPLRKT